MKKIDLVIKIGSMALINKDYNDINYNVFARLSRELRPGYALVSSGATEIGRLDYIKRNGGELRSGTDDERNSELKNAERTVEAKCGERNAELKNEERNVEAKCGDKSAEAGGTKSAELKDGTRNIEAKCGDRSVEAKCGDRNAELKNAERNAEAKCGDRNAEADGTDDEIKTDYAAQGQSVLMQNYRQFVDSKYSIRQILVEHQHFNDKAKREHLKAMLSRCPDQNAVPIINYNDAVSDDENRKMEIQAMRRDGQKAVECVDNDETAAQIACLLGCGTLLILTGTDGIYRVATDPSTLVEEVSAESAEKLVEKVAELQKSCVGASRKGAFGALAKLEYIKEPLRQGIKVIISNSVFKIDDILNGKARRTIFYLE